MPILDQYGRAIPESNYKKAPAPTTGEKFGVWAGRKFDVLQLPGGGLVQFDLSNLTLTDYRSMRTHYQVNSSLSVLSFMQHQSNWTIDHPDKKVADFCTANLTEIWTQLNRGMSQSNWAGYSPNVLQWENDDFTNSVQLTKIKDLVPEECDVHWKEVDGYTPPGSKVPKKLKLYDGIDQIGWPDPIPVDNTYWYPILMENGNYYGSKLLKSAYTSYFFSMLLHLFSNRYYERFGEPTPVGRAPQDDFINVPDGAGGQKQMAANEYMVYQLQQLRNRSTVVLPSDRGMDTNGRGFFDYDLEYLESQMRGADFERYMQRLDEEISLAIFTPVLLMKTADVGSYNLGIGHMQMYLWMLNAINADRAQYINKYILKPMALYNFSPKMQMPKIKFNKLDNTNAAMLQIILQALIGQGSIKFDTEQLGEMAGLTISEVKQTLADPVDDLPVTEDQTKIPAKKGAGTGTKSKTTKNNSDAVRENILDRVERQVNRAFRDGQFNRNLTIDIGYRNQMERALVEDGVIDAHSAVNSLYGLLEAYSADLIAMLPDGDPKPDNFIDDFTGLLDYKLSEL